MRPGVRDRPRTATEHAFDAAMIRRSDNAAAAVLIRRLGVGPLRAVGRAGGEPRFVPQTGVWGASAVTAGGQARLFQRLRRVVPPRHGDYVLRPGLEWSIAAAGRSDKPLGARETGSQRADVRLPSPDPRRWEHDRVLTGADPRTPWTGSASAALLLLDGRRQPDGPLLVASLKELVLRRALRIATEPRSSVLGVARRPRHVLHRTTGFAAEPPLPELLAAIEAVPQRAAGGWPVRDLGRTLRRRGAARLVRDATREDLVRRGLLEIVPRGLRRSALRPTADGRRLRAAAKLRRTELLLAIGPGARRRDRDPARTAGLLAAAGTLVVLVPGAVDELAVAHDAWRRHAGDGGGVGAAGPPISDGDGEPGIGGAADAVGAAAADLTGTLAEAFERLGDAFGGLGHLDGLAGIEGGFVGFEAAASSGGGFDGGAGDGGGGGG